MSSLLSVDEEPPTVVDCSGPNSTIYSSDTQTYVDWKTPVFTDNSGLNVNITIDNKPGYFRIGKFSPPQQKFSYLATVYLVPALYYFDVQDLLLTIGVIKAQSSHLIQ